MTIPSRPAPAPPGSRGQIAAAGANASLEQLRLQLQQQQQQQKQNGGIQKLTIKLPPPPKGPVSNGVGVQHKYGSTNNNNNNASSITRKFPQARYAPATDWDDAPFEAATAATNGNFKKMPPPRPPPPKVQINGRKVNAPTPPATQSANLLTNIFQRKKSAKAATNTRIYGVSSGTVPAASSAHTSYALSSSSGNGSASANWNGNWNSSTTTTTAYATTAATYHASSRHSPQEAQLISFDSPPSSPTFTQKSNSDCVSVDSFSSDSNFSSPNSVSQPESGFEDDFSAARSRPPTTSPLDPWETLDAWPADSAATSSAASYNIGTAPVRNLGTLSARPNDNPLCNGKSLLPPAPSLHMPTIIKPKISQKPKAPKPPLFVKPMQQANSVEGGYLATPTSPPMPQFTPPPPPSGGVSLLDVISGKVDAIHLSTLAGGAAYGEEPSQPPYGYALYDFDSTEEGDLSFRENEKIYLLEQVSAEWYRGRTRAGCEGILPANYIDIRVPLPDETTAAAPALATNGFTMQMTTTSTSSSSNQTRSQPPARVRCLYNFPAEVEGDLALQENDLVTILYKINEDWLYGEIAGRQGQFPANFLEYVPPNLPMP